MSFKSEYGELIIFNAFRLYEIEYDNVKLNRIHRDIELMFENMFSLNHNRFYSEDDIFNVMKFLEKYTNSINNEILLNDDLSELVEEIIFDLSEDIVELALEYEFYEMAGNVKKIRDKILEKIMEV